MNSVKAYSLFTHGLNLQLHQLAGTMVTSENKEEVDEIMKKAMVYGKGKGGSSQGKTENKQKWQKGGKHGGKGSKGNWPLVVDQRQKSKLFHETPIWRSLPG